MTVVPSALRSSTDVLEVWHAMHELALARVRDRYGDARSWRGQPGNMHWFPETPPALPTAAAVIPGEPPSALATLDDYDGGAEKVTTIASRPALLDSRHHEPDYPRARLPRGLWTLLAGPRLPGGGWSWLEPLHPLWDRGGRLRVSSEPAGTAWATIHALVAGASSKEVAAYADTLKAGQAKAWRREAKELEAYADSAEALIGPLSAGWYAPEAVQAALDATKSLGGTHPPVRPVRLRPGA